MRWASALNDSNPMPRKNSSFWVEVMKDEKLEELKCKQVDYTGVSGAFMNTQMKINFVLMLQ